MKRLLTAAIGVPLALGAVFLLPDLGFFALVTAVVTLGAREFARLTRPWAPTAPLRLLMLLVPIAAVGLGPLSLLAPAGGAAWMLLLEEAAFLSIALGVAVLLLRTPVEEAVGALGVLCFGIPYLALPAASLYHLQRHDPWVVLLLLAIVWLGDTAAFYVGTAWGRHRLAPQVSPKKTWEGAAAGLAAALLATLLWSWWRIGGVDWALLILGAGTGVAAQLGDLVESMIKRGAGVKDSGTILPGHGGVLDRIDALLFAAPVLLIGIRWLGQESLLR